MLMKYITRRICEKGPVMHLYVRPMGLLVLGSNPEFAGTRSALSTTLTLETVAAVSLSQSFDVKEDNDLKESLVVTYFFKCTCAAL